MLPFWLRLKANNETLKLTDSRMNRLMFSQKEAVDLGLGIPYNAMSSSQKGSTNFTEAFGKDINKFTVEHKTPLINSPNPKGLFFDLDNIAFSHASCNYSVVRRKKGRECPSTTAYRNGCRCRGCKDAINEYKRKNRILD